MAEILDPEVKVSVRDITDRFVRLGKGTPIHEVQAKLGRNRRGLADLERQGFIQKLSTNYLPRLRAEEFEDPKTRNYIRNCTGMVLAALKWLYTVEGAGGYTAAEVLTTVKQRIDPTVEPEMVTVGLLFAADFAEYFVGRLNSPEGLITLVTISDNILDFESFDQAWEQEQKRRELTGVVSAVPVNQSTRYTTPTPEGGFSMARYGRWETVDDLGKGGQGQVFLAVDNTKYDSERIAVAIRDAIKV